MAAKTYVATVTMTVRVDETSIGGTVVKALIKDLIEGNGHVGEEASIYDFDPDVKVVSVE